MQGAVMRLQHSSVLPRTGGSRAQQQRRVLAGAARTQRPGHQQQDAAGHSQQQRAAALSLAAAPALAALAAPLAALAEEAAVEAAAAPAAEEVSPAFYALAFSPIVIYGLFTVFRAKVNPKANIGDLLYIIGAVAVFGNIVSILIFKTRFF
ncbi:hypothetical protein MNEG_13591 [Monoraphidium neglectum]|uniref:Uncharacterized protein n=1 Tax=Monoraphidium neglectum TaxID=145388 RepID=A0A0D2MH34_9CHLO|nr:hypothetical protein MNEG_13591 [Monoraphidium neglectum]KIY94370.1 hypothetical protein MNEG_13591 [Monoraphidium neglectum]|eukprot:XP_013893390.1 hypothetical protein MNEG_13591 [Monoraphidium neglectum]